MDGSGLHSHLGDNLEPRTEQRGEIGKNRINLFQIITDIHLVCIRFLHTKSQSCYSVLGEKQTS